MVEGQFNALHLCVSADTQCIWKAFDPVWHVESLFKEALLGPKAA